MPPWIARVQRLDAAVHHLGKPGDVRDVGHGQPGLGQRRAVPPVDTSSKPRATRPRAKSTRPVLSETLIRARGMGLVRWEAARQPSHARRSPIQCLTATRHLVIIRLTRAGVRRVRPRHAVFFCAPRARAGGLVRARGARCRDHSKQEEERCASQARSSGSTTPRATGSSSARVAATCSCTTRRSRAPASVARRRPGGRVRDRRRSQGPAGRQRHQGLATSCPAAVAPGAARARRPAARRRRLSSLRPRRFSARAVKLTFPSFTATRNATSGCPSLAAA